MEADHERPTTILPCRSPSGKYGWVGFASSVLVSRQAKNKSNSIIPTNLAEASHAGYCIALTDHAWQALLFLTAGTSASPMLRDSIAY
jgi:hypothetical protein